MEITGPVDRKMVINALNSRGDVFMAVFEDSTSPSPRSAIGGCGSCSTPRSSSPR
jgi:malate synthase